MSEEMYKRAGWIANTNIYEVNIRQYTVPGTFDAFAKELPRLKEMGVEVLWIMPVHPIGKANRKGTLGSYYSIADFKAVNPEFGAATDFSDLIIEAHKLGMKVIMDWVANHASWDNVWTTDHPEYFERDSGGNFKTPYDWTDVIQINHNNPAEQEAMIDAMKYWVINFDIDGFRADLAHLTPLDFWKKARTAIEPLKPDLFWLAESEEINYHEVFDATFTWEWMHKTENYFKGDVKLDTLFEVLKNYNLNFPPDAYRMYFTSNHDENSWNGTAYEKYGKMTKVLSVFSFTWNGIPMIYSGEELPNMKRLQFFEKDTIEWNGAFLLQDFYKTLLDLKKRNPALRAADPAVSTFFILTGESKNILSFMRKKAKDEVLVFLNLSNESVAFNINDQIVNGIFLNIFDKTENDLNADRFIKMQPWGYLVFEKIMT